MKNLTKFFALVMVLFSTGLMAQSYKFGHINMQELVALMPERDSAMVKLENFGKELEETIQGMQQEFNAKYQTYNQKSATWTAAILEAKTKELQEMRARLEQFNESAQQDFANMQQQLLAPIIQKANETVENLGKEGGFIYIFDLSAGNIMFKSAESVDVLPLAKKVLGIPADKKLPQPQQLN